MTSLAAPGRLFSGAGVAADLDARRASQHLDLVRGLAAVAVLVYHVRYRFFVDYADVSSPGVVATGWYFVTAFGHDAVMIFFVLSGFLIGASVFRATASRRWTWATYLTSRAVRLYVVLIPGLLLTAMWDQAGLHWFGQHPIYTGEPQAYRHDYFGVPGRSGGDVLLGNLLYLQTIVLPPYGSNDALWSLAFEWWYYIVFPLGLACLLPGRTGRARIAGAASAAVLLYFVGATIASYFLIWLLGAVLSQLPQLRTLGRWPMAVRAAAVAQFVALTSLGHVGAVRSALGGSLFAVDSLTAVSFALCLYVLAHDSRERTAGAYARAASVLSGCSYTLYVVHLPLLVFIRAAVNPGRPWEPAAGTIAAAAGISILVLGYALAVARATEAHTGAVRARVHAWLRLGQALPPALRQPATEQSK